VTEALRIGIVGLGKMGKIRAETILENSDTTIVAATDPQPPDDGFPKARLYPNYEAVIQSDVDAVFVCTPNRFAPDVVRCSCARRIASRPTS
jgi:predicted dehydrogenase